MISELQTVSSSAVSEPLTHVLFAVPITEADQNEFNALSDAARELVINRFLIFERIHAAASRKQRAVARAESASYGGARGYSVSNLLDLYGKYRNTGDWRMLIDKARAGKVWQQNYGSGETNALPGCNDIRAFTKFWNRLCAKHKRSIRSAREELLKIWTRGYDNQGDRGEVPGYGTWQNWWKRTHPGMPFPADVPLPPGWSRSQLYNIAPDKTQRDLAREGSAKALETLPHNLSTREGLRFMEIVTFDDVKTDFRILVRIGGKLQVCDLWLLVAIDRATGLVLGYWMRPAVANENGTQSHLTLKDMKQLVGWVLWRWGLPSYVIKYKLERGTATLAQATSRALALIFGDRIAFSYNKMIGGKAPNGYAQKAKGNSRAKASHEATNNLIHNACDDIAGQTGPSYQRRPSDLAAREKHALWWGEQFQDFPAELQEKAKFPLPTLSEARLALNERFTWMNERTNHQLEGFDWIGEWRENELAAWQPLATLPAHVTPESQNLRRRKQSPLERAAQLKEEAVRAGVRWDFIPGSTLVRLYDTHRDVNVTRAGEISFELDGKTLTFAGPREELRLGRSFLGFYNEQTPAFVHLTEPAPSNAYICTCALRGRGRDGDAQALEESMRYTQAARTAAEEQARELAEPEAKRIADIDAHNAELLDQANADRFAIDADAVSPATRFDSMQPANAVTAAINGADAAIQQRQDNLKRASKVNTTEAVLNRPAPKKREKKLIDY